MNNASLSERAPYNRTISVTQKEIEHYKKDLLKAGRKLSAKELDGKIILGNLFEALDYLPDNFIDLLFIDPPYNLSKKFNTASFKEMNPESYQQWIESWLEKMVRLLKPEASIYICGDWKSSSSIFNAGRKFFKVQNRITWEREKGRGAKKNWKNCTEDIWFFTMSSNYIFNIDEVKMKRKVLAPYRSEEGNPKDWQSEGEENYRITHPSNMWTDITVPFWSMPENTDHPTQKPEKLLAKLILASSNKGDFVFDPFMGSGSTLVTAKKLGRRFSGIDIDELYCIYAAKRLALAEEDKSIQGYDGKIFWERNTLSEQKKNNKNDKPKHQQVPYQGKIKQYKINFDDSDKTNL